MNTKLFKEFLILESMSLEKINGEKVDKIMNLLDESGKQSIEINTAKMGPTLKHLYNEKMNNFRHQYSQILRLIDELRKEDPNYKINHPEIDRKANLILDQFAEYEKHTP